MKLVKFIFPLLVAFILVLTFYDVALNIIDFFYGPSPIERSKLAPSTAGPRVEVEISYFLSLLVLLAFIIYRVWVFFRRSPQKLWSWKVFGAALLIPSVCYGILFVSLFSHKSRAAGIYLATMNSDPIRIKRLSYLGADPNTVLLEGRNKVNGYTPLIIATMKNDKETVKVLLDIGANKLARDSKGRIALDIARKRQYLNIIALLEEK